ncbi:MAG: family 10 glycosylhydrolase [Myxococcota bacterium]
MRWPLAVAGFMAWGCRAPVQVPEPEPVPVSTIDVGHTRELRGVWVATVANIDFPSRPGLPAEAQQAELVAMLDLFQSLGFNAVFFQVRPEGDAFYRSDLEPWSRFLTGVQGQDPGYDPLDFVVREAHARGIAVHAWFNPYRAKTTRKANAVAPHLSVLSPDTTRTYGALLWMDPGVAEVRERTVAVVRDVVTRYDIDGVHFDDYFYPYPNGTVFPDQATYGAYVAEGGTLDLADWRRENVNTLVREVASTVREVKPWVAFGVSPFGIYRPGQPEGIRGLDQYADIYADPLTWVDEGSVDYLAPQLYWPSTQKAQAHDELLHWWADTVGDKATVYVGNYLSQVGATPAWSVDEFRHQHSSAREHSGIDGNIWFSGKPLLDDRQGVRAMFTELYDHPALPPPTRGNLETVALPRVDVEGSALHIDHDDASVRSFVIYRSRNVPASPRDSDAPHWTPQSILSADGDGIVDLEPGAYAVAAVGKHGAESPAVPVLVE